VDRPPLHQLLLASCGYADVHGARASATDENPITGHNYKHHASASVQYLQNHFVALGSFTPVWIYFFIPSPLQKQKMLRPSFVTDAVQGRSRPSLRAGIVFGQGTLFLKTRVLSSAREGATNQEKGPTMRTHLAQQRMTTATTNKLLHPPSK